MFARCGSLSAAEEIKVKQNKGDRGRTTKRVGRGERKGRIEEGCRSCWVYVVRNSQFRGFFVRMREVCNQSHSNVVLYSVSLLRCRYMDKYTLHKIHCRCSSATDSLRQPIQRQAGWAIIPLPDSRMVRLLKQSTSMVTNNKLMSH